MLKYKYTITTKFSSKHIFKYNSLKVYVCVSREQYCSSKKFLQVFNNNNFKYTYSKKSFVCGCPRHYQNVDWDRVSYRPLLLI